MSPPASRDRSKQCLFHRDHRHDTENFVDLRRLVEGLIRRGKYNGFVAGQPRGQRNNRRSPTRGPRGSPGRGQPTQRALGEIRVISGGLAGGDKSSTARKKYVRGLSVSEVLTTERLAKKARA